MYITLESLIATGGAIAFLALFFGIIRDCFFDTPKQSTPARPPEPEPAPPAPAMTPPQNQTPMFIPYPVGGGGYNNGGGGYIDPQKLHKAMQLIDFMENGGNNGGRRGW